MSKINRASLFRIIFFLVVIVATFFDYIGDRCFGWKGGQVCGNQAMIPAGIMILVFLYMIIFEVKKK